MSQKMWFKASSSNPNKGGREGMEMRKEAHRPSMTTKLWYKMVFVNLK